MVFSTAHKSKGLEFDTVRMVDDFLICEIGKMGKKPGCSVAPMFMVACSNCLVCVCCTQFVNLHNFEITLHSLKLLNCATIYKPLAGLCSLSTLISVSLMPHTLSPQKS